MKETFSHLKRSSLHLAACCFAIVGLQTLSSCEKLPLRPEAATPTASGPANQVAKGENPYSVAIMRQAYANLLAKQAAA